MMYFSHGPGVHRVIPTPGSSSQCAVTQEEDKPQGYSSQSRGRCVMRSSGLYYRHSDTGMDLVTYVLSVFQHSWDRTSPSLRVCTESHLQPSPAQTQLITSTHTHGRTHTVNLAKPSRLRLSVSIQGKRQSGGF